MIAYVHAFVLPAAFALLPRELDTLPARAMLLAIGLQESKFFDRYQLLESGRRGPARGFWQFELGGGVVDVLTRPTTKRHIASVLDALRYAPAASACYEAIEHNDILAACFARLNLLTHPSRNPRRDEPDLGWRIYAQTWRPGKPHPDTWPGYFARAWEIVEPAGPSAEITS